MIVTKRYTFEAAHHLPHHQGKCRRPHGHSYKLEVSINGPVRPVSDETGVDWSDIYPSPEQPSDVGMVMDFGDLSAIVKHLVIEKLDHQDLNVVLPAVYPTAENLALWIFRQLDGQLGRTVHLNAVRLWETEGSSVTCTSGLGS